MTDSATLASTADPSVTAPATDGGDAAPGRSLSQDAWRQLRKRPLFWISSLIILTFVLMALFPSLFTNANPEEGLLSRSRLGPGSEGSLFGFDHLGRDIYARSVYGTRASIMVGVLTTAATTALGVALGTLAGFRGGWIDSLVSRLTDMIFAIPMILGGIIVMSTFPNKPGDAYLSVVLKVVGVLLLFGWPGLTRLMRGSVLQVKNNEYVHAARALGASPMRIVMHHILPNALAPVIVVATINLGSYIAAEATLSFLGIGLQAPATSWGTAINDSIEWYRAAPHTLIVPSIFLSLCVLAFMTLGDVVRDAFDPKQR